MATQRKPMPVNSLRILVADDHEVVRRGLKTLLSSKPDWVICESGRLQSTCIFGVGHMLTSELLDLLKARKKNATSRWIFVNENGDPEGHFLRKFKVIAKRAGLNCGQCETELTDGKYDKQNRAKVSCANRPVCGKHYLHRLRKTAATRWLRSGINLLDIQNWLGHKSLETTQIYLGYSKTSSNRDKVDAAGKF